jgi:hypothetical protein
LLASPQSPAAQFFPHDGVPYCEAHYVERFCDRCAHCSLPIRDEALSALGCMWHPECLTCVECGTQLGVDGELVCRDEPADTQLAAASDATAATLAGALIGALAVPAKTAAEAPDELAPHPMCENCWNRKYGDVCPACEKLIDGAALEALGSKWHPECFKCTSCANPFGAGDPFFSHADMGANDTTTLRPYCKNDFVRLFCDRCGGCSEPIAPEEEADTVRALGRKYHRNCLLCSVCETPFGPGDPLIPGPAGEHEGKLFCKADYTKMFADK